MAFIFRLLHAPLVSAADPTRSYFSERNSVSIRERYTKSEKDQGFDILCMRSPGVRGIRANASLCAALICSVARAWVFRPGEV